jgi:2-dehydro-3-deoxyglucarate aldolase/4-hydroxy-2-oxoheptanedioate aldolase
MAQRSLRERAIAGEPVNGAMIFECYSPGMAQIMKVAGCEYVIYDMEHSAVGFETIKEQCSAARGLGIAPMARVPVGHYHYLARALDIGCEGVMIPMVDSLEQARQIAESCRYPGDGRRGAAFSFSHDHFEPGAPADKIKFANARNLVIAQIETERGVESVEKIAAVPGIDVLWVGHFDLSNFLGIPGDFAHPKFKSAIERIVKAARSNKKGLGYMSATPQLSDEWRALGFNMIAAGTDPGLLIAGVKSILAGAGTAALSSSGRTKAVKR